MTRTYSEAEAIELIEDLDDARLVTFVQAHIIQPLESEAGRRFREADLARLQLLCDLCEAYDMREDALSMVMSLIDQMNTMRGDMRVLIQAVALEPDDVRRRIHKVIRHDPR